MSSAQEGDPASHQQRPDPGQDTEMQQAPAAAETLPTQPPPQSSTSTTSTANAPLQPTEPSSTEVDAEPSSTPAPEETPAAPPLVPGPRASRLQAVFSSIAKHTLDKINKDNFASCFPTIATKAPGTLEFVQRQMVERLGGLWDKEFETILQNRSVVARLNELEALVADANSRRQESTDASPPVAPHTLPASTILHAHLHPHLTASQSQLNAKLQNTQSTNTQLWDEILAQRAELESLLAGVEKVLRDMDGANSLLEEVVEELAEETRVAEGEVRAAVGGGARTGTGV